MFEARRDNFFFNIGLADQSFIKALSGCAFQTESTGSVTLRIQINQEYPFAFYRKTGRQIHGSGCFADSAFLVCDREQLH